MSAEWQWERPDTLGVRLQFLRESFGLKAASAALAVGFDDQSWRNWESGAHSPSSEKIAKIAARFEGRDAAATQRLAAWIAFGGALPPQPVPPTPFATSKRGAEFPSSVATESHESQRKPARKAVTRRNSVYNSVTRAPVAA